MPRDARSMARTGSISSERCHIFASEPPNRRGPTAARHERLRVGCGEPERLSTAARSRVRRGVVCGRCLWPEWCRHRQRFILSNSITVRSVYKRRTVRRRRVTDEPNCRDEFSGTLKSLPTAYVVAHEHRPIDRGRWCFPGGDGAHLWFASASRC